MRWISLLLITLIACLPLPEQRQEQASSKPIVPITPDAQKEPAPVLASEPKAPQEVIVPKVNVTVVPPPEQQTCAELCESDCERSAQSACSQKERSECKANCGDIADPSACSQACSFLHQPSFCRDQLEKFCKNKCVEVCH